MLQVVDEEVKRVSQQAVTAVGLATRMFLEALAEQAHRQASSHKRSTVRFCDVLAAAGEDPRLVEMGLKEVLQTEAMFAAARGEAGAARKGKQVEPVPASKSIAKFFSRTAPAAVAVE